MHGHSGDFLLDRQKLIVLLPESVAPK